MEIQPLCEFLEENGDKLDFFSYKFNDRVIYTLVTGVGSVATAFGIATYPKIQGMDLLINVGIAGCFDSNVTLATVFQIGKDRFADLGAENQDSSFDDIFEMKLHDGNIYPFNQGWIEFFDLRELTSHLQLKTAITVNKVNGSSKSIEEIKLKYGADIESMEGAGFFYAAKMLNLQAIQLRAVSNYVEPRNKDNWKIGAAIKNLNQELIQILKN